MSKINNDDLFALLPQVGKREGMTKMNQSLWNKLYNMNRREKMTNEDLRYACILYFKARHDRSLYESTWHDADVDQKLERAESYKRLTKELLGLYANQSAINQNIGLSLTYIPRPNVERKVVVKTKAGTLNEKGEMYLPAVGGKGKFVAPHIFFRDRPVIVLQKAWQDATRSEDMDRSKLIHTELCDEVIDRIAKRFNITFPYEIRFILTTNSYKKRL